MKQVKIFTDGSCLGNPGKGGYGVLIYYNNHKKKISKGFFYTTNNRMELMSTIVGLEKLKEPCYVTITTDSKYVKNGITKWIKYWKKNNWKKKNKKKILNLDLWKRLNLITNKHKINWKWVKSHSKNKENEKCDKLAKKAAYSPTEQDIGYNKKIKVIY